ncbi:nucleoside hydrolase [bacterium]|nr:nucleoside hydrolase [bacterium]
MPAECKAARRAVPRLLGFLALTFLLAAPGQARAAAMRLIIDTDAALERDDQHAIAYALLFPEKFEILGLTAVHSGENTLEGNFREVHTVLGLAGVRGIPVLRGAEHPLPSARAAVESPAARFIVDASKLKGEGPLVILGLGAATNLASALLIDPSLKERAEFVWLGGADWPEGEGGEHNSLLDLEAQRVLMASGARLSLIPPGNNHMATTRWVQGERLRGLNPLADYLNLLLVLNRFPDSESFNLPALAAVAALAHPERVARLKAKAPWVDERGAWDFSHPGAEIEVLTGLDEDPARGPCPVWEEFYGRLREAAPRGNSIYERVCRVLNVPTAAPDVQAVEGKVERFRGFTRQEVRWPTIFGEEVPAFVCRPENAPERPLPAVICLSGTGGDRFVLTEEMFGIADYRSLGRPTPQEPHMRLHGWASELARRGYVTLALTQRGLGDRGFNEDRQSKAYLIEGFTAQGVLAYEIRQGLSYLQARPDVDSSRVGCTGMSFGGITTFFATACDPRFAAAAPLCGGVGSWRRMIQLGDPGYHGVYWWVPGILQHFDQGDIVAAQAPRPYFIAAPLEDIGMPSQGVEELLEKAQPAYHHAGAPDNLVAWRPHGEHGFTLEMFEELVKFLDAHL